MARMPRLVVPGYPHHVTQRGNRRQRTFFTEDDYRRYIALVSESAREAETEVWAYCLMHNHPYLVMVPSTEDGLRVTLGEASDFLSNRHPSMLKSLKLPWRRSCLVYQTLPGFA